MTWHLVTGEFPPGGGGIADYAALLAQALAAAGDEVHVWCPGIEGGFTDGYERHPLPDRFGPPSRQALEQGMRRRPGTLLLQYVPNALGARGANLGFCRWLRDYGRTIDVRVMFHEPYFYFTVHRPWRNALAVAQRWMARALVQGSSVVYVSTERWKPYLDAVTRVDRVTVLPIPSTIPRADAPDASQSWRERIGGARSPVIGHFGTYGADVGGELAAVLPGLARRFPEVRVALLGGGGPEFASRLSDGDTSLAPRIWSSGRLAPRDMASAIAACDLLLQPYPDGVTTRRTSVMAGLRNSVATITTSGLLTEPIWSETGAAALVPVGDTARLERTVERLLGDTAAREVQAARGCAAYDACFSIVHTVARLRGAA